ncbi:MAG: lipid A export permease/ATP-binding protein MsbA [Xanthomonadaceae bacterium]|nr:lipid A export permease/ATP-binding protein MsbA [Xanthomonadaceae bacterium]MDE2055420.1 lipid A export permease/ATP-binding protein MsbA [Xanthomonadaceae bacterium]MDE2224432.1 lipid A export permease/ATP-binding protein MsbA [Xanthomonadaceae bacterium]MDE2498020.1 lipid A export permease/ATP-binding protein MsbA [Xanthomonadaceae bacterium]
MSRTAVGEVSDATTYRRLLALLSPFRWVVVVTILAMVADAVCMTLFAKEVKPLVDKLFVSRDPHMIFWMPIIIVSIFFVRSIAVYIESYGSAYVGRSVVQDMRRRIFDKYLRMPTTFFDRESSGQQISRITYTSEQVAQATTDSAKIAIVDGLTVVGLVAMMLWTSWLLTLALLVMVPSIGILVTYVSRRYRRINTTIQDVVGRVTGVVEEVVGAHREVKVFGGQDYEAKRFDDVTDRTRKLNIKVAATNGLSTAFVQLAAAIALALIVFFATRPFMAHRGLTAGGFMRLFMCMGGILPSLKRLTTVQSNIQRGLAAAQELFGIIDAPVERDEGTRVIELCRGDIEFRDVHLTYAGASTAALRGISLDCPPGSITALVGRSGSGKSSLASLIPRFYEPTSGEVLLDGHPLGDYTLRSLRAQIAWVGQDVVLFDDTIAKNIAYGALAGASEAAITAAAEAANAMEFVRELPAGIHSRVGEGGALLSGGQRQRIAVARALLKNAPILVLDEATSALDTESERLIQDALSRLMKNRTTLVIAHRLSTVEHADQIVVLDQGHIVERGTHVELLARGGKYAALYHLQFRDAATAAA